MGREAFTYIQDLGNLPLDQNSFRNKVQNVDVVLGAQWCMPSKNLCPCILSGERIMIATTTNHNGTSSEMQTSSSRRKRLSEKDENN